MVSRLEAEKEERLTLAEMHTNSSAYFEPDSNQQNLSGGCLGGIVLPCQANKFQTTRLSSFNGYEVQTRLLKYNEDFRQMMIEQWKYSGWLSRLVVICTWS